jgi:hypothetical protein
MPGSTKASLGVPMARWGGHDGRMAAQHTDVWPHILWTPGRKVHGHLAARCPGLTEPATTSTRPDTPPLGVSHFVLPGTFTLNAYPRPLP